MSQGQPAVPEPPPPPLETPVIEPSSPGPAFLASLAGLYTAPGEAFARILARPRWVWPLVAGLVVAMAFMAIWLQKVDPLQIAQMNVDEGPFADRMSAEERADAIRTGARYLKPQYLIGMLVGNPLFVFFLGGLFLFVYRFFYGAEVRYAQSLAVVSWALLVVSLVTNPLTLAVLGLKGEWNVDPRYAFQGNLSLFLDQESASKPLYALAQEIDLFSFWTLFLLACGFGVAARKTTAAAFWGVLVPWAVYVVGKVGLVALMS